jgi:hypothetical protein
MVHKGFANNPNFPKLTKFNNIVGKVKDGDPLLEPILQFTDFFAYVPWVKCTTKCERISRYADIKHKYYNLDYPWPYKRGNYEI